MKGFTRPVLALLAVAATLCAAMGVAWSSEVSEGQVVMVQEMTLFIRTAQNEPLSFNPYYISDGKSAKPARPANTILPALEPGEIVRVTWTLDLRENRRRIDNIEIISLREGIVKGQVVTASTSQLVIRPKDEPGTVTLNPRYVQIERKWVIDPAIAKKLAGLAKNAPVTIRWAWDIEGRKRIIALETTQTLQVGKQDLED